MKRRSLSSILLAASAALALAACGDNDAPPVTPDGPPADAPPDAPTGFTKPTAFSFRLSAAGPDQMQAAWPGPNGTFYTAGFSGAAVGGPFNVVVTRLTSTGPDTTFGTMGVVTTTLVTPGAAGEIAVATQSDGKIIVSSTVVNATIPADRDIAVLRLTATGALDTTFGVDGIRVLDLSTNITGSNATDASRGLAIDKDNNIFIHGVQRGVGNIIGGDTPRLDSDFAVVKLTANGAVDTAWGTQGKHLQDIYLAATHSNATPRGIAALADGSVIAGGYSNAIGTVQPVLFKLSATGQPVTTFATMGLYHEVVLAAQTEVYNFAVHGDKLVTGGYGRAAADPNINNWISLRFDANTGVRDTTWGATANGAVVFDPSGANLSSNLRNVAAMPGGKTLLVGSTGPSNMPTQDAVFAVLDASGKLDTKYGTGIVKYELGSNGNDQFWGAAVNGNFALVVGYKGGLATLPMQTATANDDAYGVIIPLQ
jgi:uncharacterized delta-60 repeat protein